MKINIICDLDNTISNTDKAIWTLYRMLTQDYSTDYKKHNQWWYDDICPKWNRVQQDEIFCNPKLFKLLEPMENSIHYLEKLHNEGHRIIICTVHNPLGILHKSRWIKRNLPFVDSVIYVDSDGKLDKSMVVGDVILDDSPKNLKNSKCKYKCCFGTGEWTKEWDGDRCKTFKEFYEYVNEINNKN